MNKNEPTRVCVLCLKRIRKRKNVRLVPAPYYRTKGPGELYVPVCVRCVREQLALGVEEVEWDWDEWKKATMREYAKRLRRGR